MADDKGHHANDPGRARKQRRALRAVFAADVAGFSGHVSVDETAAFQTFGALRRIALEQLEQHDGWLFGMPGDGIFALFESAIDAVRCGLDMQTAIAKCSETSGMKLRVGVHLGEVRFDNDLPFGETLAIAARLESLAEPGGILVSASVVDAVAARVSAIFEPRGTPQLKNIPRRVATFAVLSRDAIAAQQGPAKDGADLDRTTHLNRDVLRQVRDSELGQVPAQEGLAHETLTEEPPSADLEVPQSPAPRLIDRISEAPSGSGAKSISDPEPSPGQTMPDVPSGGQPEQSAVIIEDAEVPTAVSTAISTELKEILAEILAHHVGPLAPVLVEQFANQVAGPDELVNRLEEHVPSGDERTSFRLRATRACLRHR